MKTPAVGLTIPSTMKTKPPMASLPQKGSVKKSVKAKHKPQQSKKKVPEKIPLSSSEDEDDDEDGPYSYLNAADGKKRFIIQPPSTLPPTADDRSHNYSTIYTDNSISTIPTASQFSHMGIPSSQQMKSQSASSLNNNKCFESVNNSNVTSGGSVTTKGNRSVFDTDYYAKAGHVVVKPKRIRRFIGAAQVTPSSPGSHDGISGNEDMHPYSWL